MTRAPHVLVDGVVLSQPMGGVRRHNAELLPRAARLLAAAGGSLSLLEGRDGLPFDPGPEVRRLTSSVPPGPPLRRALVEGRALEEAARTLAAEGAPIDLVHTAHLPVPRMGLPFTLTLHDLRVLELEHTPLSRRLVARSVLGGALRRARAVVTVSETVRLDLLERFRLDPAHVHLVPNAADHLRPLPRDPAPDAPLLHVGHLEPRKNLALLLHALALDPDLPDLLLAGAARPGERERLEALAASLGIAPRVHFHGPFEDADLPALLARAACLALPSHLEGYGLPLAEALHASLPAACARTGALPEVAAGAPVEWFPPDDPAACAHALRAAVQRRHVPPPPRPGWDDSALRLVAAWTAAVR